MHMKKCAGQLYLGNSFLNPELMLPPLADFDGVSLACKVQQDNSRRNLEKISTNL